MDTYRGKKDPPGPRLWTYPDKIAELADELAALNQRGFNIYMGIGARKLQKKKSGADNVSHCRVLVVDFDRDKITCDGPLLVELKNRIDKHKLPKPSLIVATGNGYHAYWRLMNL